MKNADELTLNQALVIIDAVQLQLFCRSDGAWDLDKPLGADELGTLVELFTTFGLAPNGNEDVKPQHDRQHLLAFMEHLERQGVEFNFEHATAGTRRDILAQIELFLGSPLLEIDDDDAITS